MKITDNRGKTEELSFEDLVPGKVYVSHRYQSYFICTDGGDLVNLENGTVYDEVLLNGDVFTLVKAHLVIE